MMLGPPTCVNKILCCGDSAAYVDGTDWGTSKKEMGWIRFMTHYRSRKAYYLTWWRGIFVIVTDLDIVFPHAADNWFLSFALTG